MKFHRQLVAFLCTAALGFAGLALGEESVATQDAEFFEREIRPLFVSKCASCHSGDDAKSGLRLTSRDAALRGGKRGPALVPSDAGASRLIQAVRRRGRLKMPPKGALSSAEVRALEAWIDMGASWPGAPKAVSASVSHWAFRRPSSPSVPDLSDDWIRNPVDAFVLARLRGERLAPSPEASRRVLLRRLSYVLRGLPPSARDVRDFERDHRPGAYERWVDRYLESPAYGERLARHWLDVARYSDTKGYVYGREERAWLHSWAYRDWVIRALNEDVGYDRFLKLQIAGEQMDDRRPSDLAAMGFLTLGRRFLGVERDIVDDRIDVLCRGTMALTVACARCHDHKYDPIPTADYYSLFGVFASSRERIVPLPSRARSEAFDKGLEQRRKELDSRMAKYRAEAEARARKRVAEYLEAQTRLAEFPAKGFDQVFSAKDLLPIFARRWEDYLAGAARLGDPVFVAWHRFRALDDSRFERDAPSVSDWLQSQGKERVHPSVAQVFRSPPASFREVVDRYANLFLEVEKRWEAALTASPKNVPKRFEDAHDEVLRSVLYGPSSPCSVPDEDVVDNSDFFDTPRSNDLWAHQKKLDRFVLDSKPSVPFALTLEDRTVPRSPRVYRRGDPTQRGPFVTRHFLTLLSPEAAAFRTGSGRRELAERVASPENPLTARVIVNRVWAYIFGRGLVATPSDFGLRSSPPSHPDLLDWLAIRFVEDDAWSLKKLHRRLVLSATFRQSPEGPEAKVLRERAVAIDPSNRLLWRSNAHRLSFEEIRDSMLAVSGDLNRRAGGKAFTLFGSVRRRSIYGFVDRQFVPETLRTFDFANPELHIPQRRETNVPQQALFFMNHPWVLSRSQALARTLSNRAPGERVVELFHAVFQREPTSSELSECLALVDSAENLPEVSEGTVDWSYGYGAFDESKQRVASFTPLPHFTGDAWQGGPKLPDGKLGWVMLSAQGGHPGNDRNHAAIRRWTAPRDMEVQVEGRLIHEPPQGDGIRARIVSSSAGVLKVVKLHQSAVDMNLPPRRVRRGETIDFVVDIAGTLNYDQYLWNTRLRAFSPKDSGVDWDSGRDFTAKASTQLNAWEQLAQLLLCTNEFFFVD
ncbi:MAG: DUF1553 domain-containing protein [Planctomycetota bacterium]